MSPSKPAEVPKPKTSANPKSEKPTVKAVTVAKCPYCSHVLEKAPKRKKKCPSCSKYIYVRSRQLVTEDGAKKIDHLKNLAHYGVTELDYTHHEKLLAERFGQQPSVHDIVWSIFNALVVQTHDFQTLRHLYFTMALFLAKEGRDPFLMLQQSRKAELMHYKSLGFVVKVRIVTTPGCDECETQKGRVLTIDQALKEQPIPNKSCTNHRLSDKYGWCRCWYAHISLNDD